MDKQTDILYLTTAQPNRFVAYDIENRAVIRELPLNRAPTCFRLSEDSQKAIIGHSGYITSVDMDNFSVIKTIEVDYKIFDIEWGVDNWVCYTPGQGAWPYNLQWKNLDTEEIFNTPDSYLSDYTLIKKNPKQNYILASSLGSSPTGITIFDSQSRNFAQYFHKDIYDFWFSSDGNYLYTMSRQIYRTSSFFSSSNDVSPINTFSPAPFLIQWIDHHATSNSVWVLAISSNDNFDEQREIIQYEDNDYTRKASYYCGGYYKSFHVQAKYVFANKDGTELVVIRNATSGNFMWSLEFIPVV